MGQYSTRLTAMNIPFEKKVVRPQIVNNTAAELALVQQDSGLLPYNEAITGRHEQALRKIEELSAGQTFADFATGYLFFGLHKTAKEWVFREWAPNATKIYFVGDCNNWAECDDYALTRIDQAGNWELRLPENALQHGQYYKLKVYWEGGQGERLPSYAHRVVQDEQTSLFAAQVWQPEKPYQFQYTDFQPTTSPLLIYECHIGMAQDKEGVGTFAEFREKVLPRVVAAGYNCLQIMAIQEHPYYGSFGYHVANFFAVSSRFGTPEDLKQLIDEAHAAGLAVIMDLVHSHAVKNENEGLGNFAGDPDQYFYAGERKHHQAWDSLCFDYGKNEVLHFLLSNCKYWLEEYRFDGFRFDGVTSMLYYNHGLGEVYDHYDKYYNGHQDDNAICYLTLANELIHQVKPNAITIAEDVSGMPGLALPFAQGGYGFDYRLAMNIPDYWIKLIKEQKDEDWRPSSILWELTNRRTNERNVHYCESHDQALVGDKTIIFRLLDSDMYYHFKKGDETARTTRGLALHKMIRLVTATTSNGAYLNFMGNEFGHPEWIDFPRQGNDWSYKYARRQWNLVDNLDLCYHYLDDFDKAMTALLRRCPVAAHAEVVEIWHNDGDQILAYERGDLLFVFNFSPTDSYTDYGFMMRKGAYKVLLNTDHPAFGGFGETDDSLTHFTNYDAYLEEEGKGWLQLYVPARTAMVLQRKVDTQAS